MLIEKKIGEEFKDDNGGTIRVEEGCYCQDCIYKQGSDLCIANHEIVGVCLSVQRSDNKDVFFKDIIDMKENITSASTDEIKNKHFYIWGIPNRGVEVYNLLVGNGANKMSGDEFGSYHESFSSSKEIAYINDLGSICFLTIDDNITLIGLIESNWTELKLPWMPKDKELVWAWDDSEVIYKKVRFYDAINEDTFDDDGSRVGDVYNYYAPYEGEWPQWAKDAYAKLEN